MGRPDITNYDVGNDIDIIIDYNTYCKDLNNYIDQLEDRLEKIRDICEECVNNLYRIDHGVDVVIDYVEPIHKLTKGE